MTLFTTVKSLNDALLSFLKSGEIGFVPTMGALHEGHLSLVSKSLAENDCTVVSIFVNPTQFNNPTDLEKYPRTLRADVDLLQTLNGNIFIFAPNAEDIYQKDVISKHYNFGGLENEMEGKHRKGHFDGVGTVLNLLFRIVKPTKAYFGEKDFQQLQIVKKMVSLEKLPVNIIGCEIIREKSGLALSSRNKRLNSTEKKAAILISQSLKLVKKEFSNHSISELTNMVAKNFESEKILKLEYFEIADIETLKTATKKDEDKNYRAFIAAFAGEVRLIDNMAL